MLTYAIVRLMNQVREIDEAYFRANPTAESYVRPYIPGEWWAGHIPAACTVEACNLDKYNGERRYAWQNSRVFKDAEGAILTPPSHCFIEDEEWQQ